LKDFWVKALQRYVVAGTVEMEEMVGQQGDVARSFSQRR
jgi:hypothetical protein